MAETVRLDDVGYAYGPTRALSRVSLTLSHGLTGVLGPNGAGKSTLLSLLATLTRPSTGSVRILGEDTRSSAARARLRPRIGYLAQRFTLPGTLRVVDVVEYAAWVNGTANAECGAKALRALERVGMQEHQRRRVRQLSGGQRQRVGIATAIVHEPDLLLLDEPTVGLDPVVRIELRRALASVARSSAVVLSTHLVEDVLHLCPDVLVVYEGRVRYHGPTKDLSANAPVDTPGVGTEYGSPLEAAYLRLITHAAAPGVS